MSERKLKKIFCLMGYTSAGKTTLVKEILKINQKVHMSVSHTTRPMRNNETEGIDYHFIDNETFYRMKEYNEFFETRVYNTKIKEGDKVKDAIWNYGYSRMEFEDYEYCMAIVDVNGFKEFQEYFEPKGTFVIPIYINVKEDILKERALKRGDLEVEFNRRLTDDKKRFLEFRVKTLYKNINNNEELEKTVDELNNFILIEMGEVVE